MICTKRRYKDKLSAMIALSSCLSSGSKKRKETRYYWCDQCKVYHLTKRREIEKFEL